MANYELDFWGQPSVDPSEEILGLSPLPWSCEPFNTGSKWYRLLDANGNNINVDFEGKTDVEFIVRACNAHEALTTACQHGLETIQNLILGLDGPALVNVFNVMAEMTAAISKAKKINETQHEVAAD